MIKEPEITPEQLDLFRHCTFIRKEFASYPTLWAKKTMAAEDLPPPSRDGGEWHMSKPYRGEPFDPEKFELREGGWDHEHCEVCWTHVEPGDSYWPNVDEAGGHVDLCERCYPRVVALLGKPLH